VFSKSRRADSFVAERARFRAFGESLGGFRYPAPAFEDTPWLIFAFLEAADESKRLGDATVKLPRRIKGERRSADLLR
jgi:hypothetical protein